MEIALKDIIDTISLTVAALGLCATAFQLRANRNFQKENTAKAVYREYLRMAVEKAQFAGGDYDQKSEQQYVWFVSYFLWACEEVIRFAPDDEFWMDDLRSQLRFHRDYLCSKEFAKEKQLYYPALQQIITDICAEPAR